MPRLFTRPAEHMMNHRRLHSPGLGLVLAFGGLVAMAGLACGSTRVRTIDGGGADGGTTGSGGAGGGTGGDTSGSGGMGGGGEGGTSSGGTGGGSTIPTITCATDAECSSGSLVCEPATKLCVQCVKSADCPSGGHCLGNACVSVVACNSRGDCGGDRVCDPGRGICVQCATNSDCPSGQTCLSNRCIVGCQQTGDCGTGEVCDTSTSKCVGCATDSDCDTGTQHCVHNVCRTSCDSDVACKPQGMLCDTASSACVMCKADADCPASSFCEDGTCKADLCDSTQAMCLGTTLVPCTANGNGWGPVSNCPADKPCAAYGSVASCGGSTATDGGVLPDDGGQTTDGLSGACTTATQNPCTTISKLVGTQTLDGKDDDLCQVPSFVFSASNAAKVNNYNNVPQTQFETVTGRVAWSSAGFSAFFDVADTSVQTVNMADPTQAISKTYQGDSLEIMISSSNNVTGLTGSDNNTLHVIVPANGPAVSVKTSNNGGASSGTPTALPAGQYKQSVTSTGYAIEVQLPWPGGAPNAGAQVRFDLGLNSADSTFGSVDDMRDGQLLYYLGSVGGTSTCQGADTVPFCDDRTWCTTSLQ